MFYFYATCVENYKSGSNYKIKELIIIKRIINVACRFSKHIQFFIWKNRDIKFEIKFDR